MARAVSESASGAERLALARSFGQRLTTAWWEKLTLRVLSSPAIRPLLKPFETIELSGPMKALATSLGEAAAELDTETAAYKIGLTYTAMLPRELRAAQGIYYTPPSLTAHLIARATEAGVDWTKCRVLDPACGGGAFLAPIACRILDELSDCAPRILVENLANRLRGYEIDPFGAWLSQVTVDAVVLPMTRRNGRRLPEIVSVRDSLRNAPASDRFDLVIGNPPYGRVRLDADDRARFERSLYGHANLYGLFTHVALDYAKPGGVIAFVTPTSFLAGEYFKNLRTMLGRDAPPFSLDFVSARKGVFDDVLQETLLATYKRGTMPGPITVHEIAPANGSSVDIADAGTFALPADVSKPWMVPRSWQQTSLVATLSGMAHRLADWGYTVSTGPLVWNRHKSQLVSGPGPRRFPLIWAEAVTGDGRFVWRAEKKNHLPYFETRAGDEWLITKKQCVLLQRTTAKEQCRRLIAATLPSDFLARHGAVIMENHLNMLRPTTDRPQVTVDVLAAFLNSAAADRAFRCVSGSVAVSAYELEALPLPSPKKLQLLTLLVRRNADRSSIDMACEQLYDGSA